MASTSPVSEKRQTVADLRNILSVSENDREILSEALTNAVAMLRQEDIGWAQPNMGQAYKGLTLDELQRWSFQIRASLTGTADKAPNPHMRNGLMLRHSFIWSGGLHYENVPGTPEGAANKDNPDTKPKRGKANVYDLIHKSPNNERLVFGDSARRKREHALYADGFYMLVGNNSNKRDIRPVSLAEITGYQSDDLYEDEIVAYRWTRNEAQRNTLKGGGKGALTGERKEHHVWVYVDWYTGRRAKKIRFNNVFEDVLDGYTAFDFHANRPEGQAFGSPDSISALVWARIIRDLIMNGVKMQDALAMFAFKASAKTKEGQKTQALEIAGASGGGNVASMAGDADFNALNSAGKGYDFGSIGFIVATMAASLHVSGIALSANTALAGSSYGAAKTLDLPGRMAMETRRAEHIEFDERILRWMGADDATAYFVSYDDATDEYRSVQAAYLMWQSGNLTPEGFRAELEGIYGRKLVGGIPKGVIVPNNQKQLDDAAALAEKTAAAKSTPAPDQGQSNGTGGSEHSNDIAPKDK